MMDFNSISSISGQVTALIDAGMKDKHAQQATRQYLGASRLGIACERALQYEYAQAPVDSGRETQGQMLRIFERGHVMEDCMVQWLRTAGFDLRTRKPNGKQLGFSVVDGRLQGHIDGVIMDGPEGFAYPALWENKCLGNKSWRELEKKRLAVAKPVYAAQIALYQAYLELHEHPALFTALNADTMEIYSELVPFDAALAQRMSDRAAKVITATEAGELLPRSFNDPTHFECKFCPYAKRCWQEGGRQ
ncbi:PD-(D/E)XK nuclease family protein [Nitrosomonas communis]|uniref:PD-(D/E)XK nuclease superfamily protein n=1 Tax=Nitrosomonas communis TaxID=44574 RepID=A0A1I4NDX7_9PROT|nr:PD-(D/E)XK nuclease family protein [Nitrosomonas communis]SFM13586.1 PD-(D/E)XK nuclease superfamily protein [Nitrosomonas communis]